MLDSKQVEKWGDQKVAPRASSKETSMGGRWGLEKAAHLAASKELNWDGQRAALMGLMKDEWRVNDWVVTMDTTRGLALGRHSDARKGYWLGEQ